MNRIRPHLHNLIIITYAWLASGLALYGYYYFFTPEKLEFIFRNWDGPGYLIVAKTLYNVSLIRQYNPFPFLEPSHYAFQFPLYPVFIRLFSFIGYNESMIFVSQLFALLYSIALYFLIREVNPKADAKNVAILSMFYTPRWFIVSHVGSTEPLFLFSITMFMLCFAKKQYIPSAIFAMLAQMTKPQGIIFFLGFTVYILARIIMKRGRNIMEAIRIWVPYLLIPVGLALVFMVYYIQYGNFFIFMGNEAFPTMQWPPLKILVSKTVYNVPIDLFTVWKEDIVYTYMIYFVGIALLWEKRLRMFSIVALAYFLPVLLFVQTDMMRFIIPILPFVMLGFSDLLSVKQLQRALYLCTPMVFLYAVGYINYNLAPYPAGLFIR